MGKSICTFGVILLTGIMLISCLPAFGQIDRNFYANGKKHLQPVLLRNVNLLSNFALKLGFVA